MKIKMKHVMGGLRLGKKLDNTKVKVCGARNPNIDSMRCTDPYWMGEHTWHTSDTGWQWCECGGDHHYALPCGTTKEPTP